jgi:hypothetical protein
LAIDHDTAILIAGLGGACIGIGGGVAVAAIQARRQTRSERNGARAAAYSRLIATTGLLMHTAQTLRLAMQFRSGINEGLDIALRLRKPMDLFDLNTELRKDLEPLYQAWAEVWTVGTQEAIATANELIGLATMVMGTATARGEGRGGIARALIGEKWMPEQLAAWERSIAELAQCRRQFGEIARAELGHDVADLWAGRVDHPNKRTD